MTTDNTERSNGAPHPTPYQISMNDLGADIRMFVGKNVDTYDSLINYYIDETPESPKGFVPSFTWMGLLFPFVWLTYRKLYFFGILTLILTVSFKFNWGGSINIDWAAPLPLLAMLVTAVGGKTFYIREAVKKVRHIRETHEAREDIEAELLRQGGTSIWGTLLGILLFGSMIAVILIGVLALL